MERNSIAYKIRRRIQTLAHVVISDEVLSKFYFKVVMKKNLNICKPKTFNEKLQWMKLYYYPYNDLVVQCTDKYAVRDYICSKGYKNILVPLVGVWDKPDEINWESLPSKFVLKCNHGCAYNIVCKDKTKENEALDKKQLRKWLREDFGAFNIELHYSKINKKKIICEEYLGEDLTDYKFFCFNGVPKYIYVSSDLIHDRNAKIGFFDLKGNKLNLKRDDYEDISSIILPVFFDQMKNIAFDLCKEFPFVRVDFFVTSKKFYFAELTFTPSACMMPFNPDIYDLEWGKELDISNLIKEK